MRRKTNEGITLIALVITIIVLLILAGVTLVTLTDNNGLLTKSNNARIISKLSTVDENIRLYKAAKRIDKEIENSENPDATNEDLIKDRNIKRICNR